MKVFNLINPNQHIYSQLATHYILGYTLDMANTYLNKYGFYITEEIWIAFGQLMEACIREDLHDRCQNPNIKGVEW